jgi:uncharacterized membrane protein YqjE
MDVSRVGRGAMIAAISGAALVIIMFLEWWGVPDTVSAGGVEVDVGAFAESVGADTSVNAWQGADFMDIIWFVTALAAIGLGVMAATATRVDLPVAVSAIVAGLGILSLLLVIIRLIDPPYELDRSYGVFLGLIAIGGIAYGGWMAMQEEGTSFGAQADRLQGRVGGDEPPAPPPPPPPSTGP